MAEFANFPPSVVALARSKAEELEDFSSADCPVDSEEVIHHIFSLILLFDARMILLLMIVLSDILPVGI